MAKFNNKFDYMQRYRETSRMNYIISLHKKTSNKKINVKDILYILNDKYKNELKRFFEFLSSNNMSKDIFYNTKTGRFTGTNFINISMNLSIEEGVYLEKNFLDFKCNDSLSIIDLKIIGIDIQLQMWKDYVFPYVDEVYCNYRIDFYCDVENASLMIDSMKEKDLIKDKLSITEEETINKRRRI